MASYGESIRAFLAGSTGVAAKFDDVTVPGVIQQNKIDEDGPLPRIWYMRSRQHNERDFDGVGGPVETDWDIECHSDDIDEALELAEEVRAVLDGHSGEFGDHTAQGVFIEDQDDDYVPKGVGSDDGIYVAALSAKMWFAST